MNFENTLNFIRTYGNALDRYRALFILADYRNDVLPLTFLKALQNDDGGFPYDMTEGNDSSVFTTSNVLGILIELRLEETDVTDGVIDFLLNIQKKDGYWDESPLIIKYNPPSWLIPGETSTITWLTAEITRLFILLGYQETAEIKRAIEYLKTNITEEGQLPGFRIATVSAFAALQGIDILDEKVAKKMENNILSWIEEERDPSFLAWYLECLLQAGFSKEHPIFESTIKRILEKQRRDGSWFTMDGERFSVAATLNVLKVLRMLNCIETI